MNPQSPLITEQTRLTSGFAAQTKRAYDNYGYLSSTSDWAISNDTLGRIQTATGHGITTTHSHDTFGNKVSHQASPTPSTMINWSFPALTNNRVPTNTSSGAQTWWNYTANGEATQIGKAPGGAYIQFGWDALGLLKAVSDNGNSHLRTDKLGLSCLLVLVLNSEGDL